MIGSDTFIIVALRCSDSSRPCALASSIDSREERLQRAAAHRRRGDDIVRRRPRSRP